jgi:hypothetical protein
MSTNIKQLLERTRNLGVTERQVPQGEFRGSEGVPSLGLASGVGRDLIACFKGTSSSEHLFDLVLRLRRIEVNA